MVVSTAGSRAGVKEPATFAAACAALWLLAKPGIVAAVAFSGLTGMVVAGRGIHDPGSALVCIASLLMMAAGSAIANCVLDRRMDLKMERLTARTAALGAIGLPAAVATALTLVTSAVLLASFFLNATAALLLVAAAVSYTVYYTLFLKPYTHLAAVLGGIPGALPVLIGHAAVKASPDTATFALCLIMLIWQPPHFWLLSLLHRDDYRAAQVPVLSLVKGEKFTKRCIYAGIAALSPATVIAHLAGAFSSACAAFALLLALFYLAACRHFLAGSTNYRSAFRCSIAYILTLFMLIILDHCLRLP